MNQSSSLQTDEREKAEIFNCEPHEAIRAEVSYSII